MGCQRKALIEKAEKVNGKGQISDLIKMITNELEKDPRDAGLAELNTKLQLLGEAMNDYRMILQHDPDNKKAAVRIEQLSTILRFRNTDIFEHPNTNFDPWLE